ncbi:hypothetical protein K438DRAFT_1769515 [Mycena galopus ATCC 62051]|nr:hypothetical protein K438DRAFT_1769515 [Mycena galopus ATCC 62051]
MDRSKLPQTWGKNALQYLEAIEDVISKVSATTDEDKKWVAIHFCAPSVQRQWRALAAAAVPGTWEEFKAEIRESYPEYKALEKGFIAALEAFVKKMNRKPVKMNDITGLQDYIRQYRAMVRQLLLPKPRIQNRDAAGWFLAGLSLELRTLIRNQMRLTPRETWPSYKKDKAAWEAGPANNNKVYIAPDLDNEDKYAWTDLVDAATKICEDESGTMLFGDGSSSDGKKSLVLLQGTEKDDSEVLRKLTDKINQLEGAKAKDDISLQDKILKGIKDGLGEVLADHLDKFTTDHHEEMQQMRTALESHNGPSVMAPNQSNTLPSFVRNRVNPDRPRSDNCFYCYKAGHFIDQCPERQTDLDKKIIQVVNGRTYFYDGKTVPREPPNKSPCEKARDHYNRRVVATNYDEIMEIYFGSQADEGPVASTSSSSMSEDTYNKILAKVDRLETRQKPPEDTPDRARVPENEKTPEKNKYKPKALASRTEHLRSEMGRGEAESLKSAQKKLRFLPVEAAVEESEGGEEDQSEPELDRAFPYRKVVPLEDPPSEAVLPIHPTTPEKTKNQPPTTRIRAKKNTELEDQASTGILKAIRETMVPIKLGDLLDSNPKIRKAVESGIAKSRRVDFVRTTEGNVLAAPKQTFLATAVSEEIEEISDIEWEEEFGSNVRLEVTTLMFATDNGKETALVFDTYPEIVTSAGHELAEGSVIMGDPVLQGSVNIDEWDEESDRPGTPVKQPQDF